MKWKKYFEYKMIDRGFDYYYDNKVHDMKITYNSVTSLVDGSNNNEYEVNIYFNKNDIDSMYCTCPYAYSTDYCKHMAATLYKYNDIMKDTIRDLKYNTIKSKAKSKNKINKIDRKRSDKYFIGEYNYTEFMELHPKTTINDFKKYKKILNKILDVNLTKLDHDSPYITGSLNRILYDFMNKIDLFYRNNQFEFIQQLLYLIYEKIAIREDVEKCIDIDIVLTWCNEYMTEVIRNQDIIKRDKTYNYFIKTLKYKYNIYTAPYILDLCLKCYKNNDYQRNTLKIVNIIIEHDEIPNEIYIIKGQLMLNLDYSYEDIKEELYRYSKLPKIQDLLVESAIKNEEYNDAIRLLEEDSNSEDNTELLIDLYKKVGDDEKYKEKIKITLFKNNEIKYIDQLKEACTKEEWDEKLKNIIKTYQGKKDYDFINKICIYYNRYEDFYKNIVDNCQLETLEEYRQYYQEEHNDDILNIYKETILEKQQTARTRKAYNTIIGYLDTMLTYNDSEEMVRELVDTMKNNKKNKGKKVFLEELRKFEYNLDYI